MVRRGDHRAEVFRSIAHMAVEGKVFTAKRLQGIIMDKGYDWSSFSSFRSAFGNGQFTELTGIHMVRIGKRGEFIWYAQEGKDAHLKRVTDGITTAQQELWEDLKERMRSRERMY